jgi:hypothetical protein
MRLFGVRIQHYYYVFFLCFNFDQSIEISKYIFLVHFDLNFHDLYAEYNGTKYSHISEYMCFDVYHSSWWLLRIQIWMGWI